MREITRRMVRILLIGMVCALSIPMPLMAAPPDARGRGPLPENRDAGEEGLTLDGVVSRIREREGGRVLSADTEQQNGDKVYRIRVLTGDGRVKRLRIDARSGRRLPSSR